MKSIPFACNFILEESKEFENLMIWRCNVLSHLRIDSTQHIVNFFWFQLRVNLVLRHIQQAQSATRTWNYMRKESCQGISIQANSGKDWRIELIQNKKSWLIRNWECVIIVKEEQWPFLRQMYCPYSILAIWWKIFTVCLHIDIAMIVMRMFQCF